jgi:hypothetical protein
VGQLLEYAARLRAASLDELQAYARRYHDNPAYDLYSDYQQFSEGSQVQRDQVARTHRLFIVAPESDTTLRSIVDWLKSYMVPIEFVPFSIYADVDGSPKFLKLEGIRSSSELASGSESWAGHWIFNTNETHAPGAFARMFEAGVAAIYEYPNGPANLEGASVGDKVLAYVNQQGLRAVGAVTDPRVKQGSGIFLDQAGNQLPEEYHLSVEWEVVPPDRAISSADAVAKFGYNLPVRSVFARLHRGNAALQLEQELRARTKQA